MQEPILLIIDPGIEKPCLDAINCILKIAGDLSCSPLFRFHHVEYFSPTLNKMRLNDFARNKNIRAVICLGSLANVTDQFQWVEHLISDLKQIIFEKNCPFFGICFSHQMMASMSGYKVYYLKERHKIKHGKYHSFREFSILHPKFALLATNMKHDDYFSDNHLDLYFREFLLKTVNWDQKHWDFISYAPEWQLTSFEFRLKKHIENNTSKSIISHARHEQEVWHQDVSENQQDVVLAATSPFCLYEALVHVKKPLFSTQTHPETLHGSLGGHLLIKNFIYMASLLL